ncbi:dihydrolipoyllysine-residue succinyltransferase [Rhodovibrio sodomensis]|uniref:Dihydrolipoyllysine-residue succinyltransferase component of 2-oxoglutarate dehydrogenase complex n=1 Tax=Rhodovibrio sodomensis TaxID=1088 RepID=A0ABS1DB70_9PROT|nr:dihydrolipoyllysine-residue succinyltransferase [Rhodovibrio sodomensis]
MATDITVPSLGESVSEATVANWLKNQGDPVSADEAIVELETDKVTLEVNAPTAGTVSEVLVATGETVEVGTVLGRIAEGQTAEAPRQPSAPQQDSKPAEQPAAAPSSGSGGGPAGGSGDDPGGSGGGESVDIPVPTLGESVSEATVASWLKNPGDAVKADEAVAELETDKVTLEVNAPADGVLSEQAAAQGETVQAGSILGRMTRGGAPAAAGSAQPAPAASAGPSQPAASEAPAPAAASPGQPAGPAQPAAQEGESATATLDPKRAPRTDGRVTRDDLLRFLGPGAGSVRPEDLAPAVRTAVQEYGVDPSRVPGSGKDGRITKQDVIDVAEGRKQPLPLPGTSAVQAAAATGPAPGPGAQQQHAGAQGGGTAPAQQAAPAPAAAATGADGKPREERVKMSKLRQTISKRLKEAQNTAAMLTTFNEVDMTAVNQIRADYKEQFEKAHGIRLGMSCFFGKAVCQALKELPAVNARIEDDEIVYNNYYNVGMAVSTPQGLMVPVIRDIDRKSFADIESELRDLAKKGRDGKLTMDEMSGGTFTITNGGVFGSLLSTPILNRPQSGILGMHKIQERPMAVNGEVQVRPMMYLALSYDHRIVDGREAVTFLVRVKECLEDPARMLLQM